MHTSYMNQVSDILCIFVKIDYADDEYVKQNSLYCMALSTLGLLLGAE